MFSFRAERGMVCERRYYEPFAGNGVFMEFGHVQYIKKFSTVLRRLWNRLSRNRYYASIRKHSTVSVPIVPLAIHYHTISSFH